MSQKTENKILTSLLVFNTHSSVQGYKSFSCFVIPTFKFQYFNPTEIFAILMHIKQTNCRKIIKYLQPHHCCTEKN